MKVAVINYNAGNTQSVYFALKRLGVDVFLSGNKDGLSSADKIVFPGVGNAKSAMKHLEDRGLKSFIPKIKVPFLGICLGIQIMCEETEEGSTTGIGIFESKVKRFSKNMRVPHMGWNTLKINRENPAASLFEGILDKDYFYFVHSYYVEKTLPSANEIASCLYNDESLEQEFSAALCKDNFYAVQFHPEKSQQAGEKLLKNFIELC